MVTVTASPENKREILLVLDLRCGELGITRSEYAVKYLHEGPHILNNLLHGRTKVDMKRHAHIVRPINKLTGATDVSWVN